MKDKFLLPTNDVVFKKLFCENPGVLENFLKIVLDLPAKEYSGLTILNPYLEPEFIGDKFSVLDIKSTTRSGTLIDIEIQVKAQEALRERMTFYTAKMLAEQLKSGSEYRHLNKAISILIADFVLFRKSDRYHHRSRLYIENTWENFSDAMEINLETAVGRIRQCCDRRARQGARTQQATACKDEQHSMAHRARCWRARSDLTQKVGVAKAINVSIHASFVRITSG